MGVNKCVNEAHHHDSILVASQEHVWVIKSCTKMGSPWKHGSLSPKTSDQILQTRAFVVMTERMTRVHSGIQHDTFVHMIFSVKSFFETCIARCRGHAKNAKSEPMTRSTR